MKRLLFITMFILGTSGTVYAQWGSGYTDLVTGAERTAISDSSLLRVLKTDVDDSVAAGIARDTSKLNATAYDDSSNARILTSIPLWWTWAYADSVASNDSLTIEIKNQTPLGTTTGLYIKNTTGLSEKVQLVLSFVLPNERANLDSIRFLTWTETTAATNWCLATVFDDSLQSNWKTLATATGDTLRSATARTARYQGVTGINIKGGTARLKLLIQTIADSMFVATPWAYYTMK